MRVKIISLLILIFLLIISNVYAQVNTNSKLEISSIKVDSKAFPGSEVIFQVIVKNNQIRSDVIKITADPFSIQPFSDSATTISASPTQQVIGGGSEGVFEVKIKYASNVKAEKAYASNIFVQSLLDPNIKESYSLTSYILSSSEIVSMKADLQEKIIPGKEFPLNVVFRNNLNHDFADMDFSIISSYFNEEHKISLLRNKETSKSFVIKLPSETQAGDYNLFLKLYKDGALKGEKEISFKIEESRDLQEKTNRENGFLSAKITLTKINNGNIKIEKTVRYEIGILERFFTETSLKGNYVRENGDIYLEWNLVINPGEQKNIVIETNYSSLFFTVFAFIILIGVVYYAKTRTLRITKRVVRVKQGKDSKAYLKVILSVQNYTSKDIHDVKIMDFLPRLIKHYSEFGTLEPKHIQQGSHGLRFIWDIHKLHSGEERVISYKIEPQLNLFGNIKLPSATLQFTRDDGLIIRKSNTAKFELKKEL